MITVPEAAARICVPHGAEMSMPSCIRPQRQPKPLVTTPLTGQMKPLAETPLPLDPLRGVVGPRRVESLLLRDERLADGDPLGRLVLDDGGRLSHVRLGGGRLRAGDAHLALQALEAVRDGPVLAADVVEVLELLEQVGEALHLEQDPERIFLPLLVELDQALFQDALGRCVLTPQVLEIRGLPLEEVLELGEARAVLGQLLLEDGDLPLEAVDVPGQGVDPGARRLDLGREHALLRLRGLDVLAQAGNAPVDLVLAVRERLPEGRRDSEDDEGADDGCEQTDAACVVHLSESFAGNADVPAARTGVWPSERPFSTRNGGVLLAEGLLGALRAPFPLRRRRPLGLRRRRVRSGLRNAGGLGRIALVGRWPGLGYAHRLRRRLQLLRGSDACLRPADALVGLLDQGVNLGLLRSDALGQVAQRVLGGLAARLVLLEHRAPEIGVPAAALSLELGHLPPRTEELELAAGASTDDSSARGEARPERDELPACDPALHLERGEKDDQCQQEHDQPPDPLAAHEQDRRSGADEEGDDDERVGRPVAPPGCLVGRGLARVAGERPAALGTEATRLRHARAAVATFNRGHSSALVPFSRPLYSRERATLAPPRDGAGRRAPDSRRRRPCRSYGRTRAP